MAATEKIAKLKESFRIKLKEALISILELIETKTEVEESYILRATRTTQGLLKIAEIEEDVTKKRIFEGLLRALKSKRIEQRETELRIVLELLG